MSTFYIGVKKNISPSGIATFYTNKSQFISSYFEGKSFSNKYTDRGTVVHKLVEDGFYAPQIRLNGKEEILEVELDIKKGLMFKGYLDTVEKADTLTPVFADYKTVDEKTKDDWNETKVFYDLKQRAYAYALWVKNGKSKMFEATGYIELIVLGDDDMPKDDKKDNKLYEVKYNAENLAEFETEWIKPMIKEANALYKTWKEGMDVEIDDDLTAEYLIHSENEKKAKTLKSDTAEKIIAEIKEKGGLYAKKNGKNFYLKAKVKYILPDDMEVMNNGKLVKMAEIDDEIKRLSNLKKSAEEYYKMKYRKDLKTETEYTLGVANYKEN